MTEPYKVEYTLFIESDKPNYRRFGQWINPVFNARTEDGSGVTSTRPGDSKPVEDGQLEDTLDEFAQYLARDFKRMDPPAIIVLRNSQERVITIYGSSLTVREPLSIRQFSQLTRRLDDLLGEEGTKI